MDGITRCAHRSIATTTCNSDKRQTGQHDNAERVSARIVYGVVLHSICSHIVTGQSGLENSIPAGTQPEDTTALTTETTTQPNNADAVRPMRNAHSVINHQRVVVVSECTSRVCLRTCIDIFAMMRSPKCKLRRVAKGPRRNHYTNALRRWCCVYALLVSLYNSRSLASARVCQRFALKSESVSRIRA